MYKIVTLGESFVFLREGDVAATEYDGNKVLVRIDEDCDFSFVFESSGILKADFLRAVSVYLFGVKGMPSSVYNIRTPYGNISVEVPRKCERIFGGDFNKCKVLFTDTPCIDNSGGISLHSVFTDRGIVKIALCDSLGDFDIERIGKCVLREEGNGALRNILAVSVGKEYISMDCFRFDGKKVADSSAYAAAYCFARQLGGARDEAQVCSGDCVALCRSAFGGALVFDKTPSVSEIIL